VAVFADAIASPIVNALQANEEIPVRDLDPGAVNPEQGKS